MIEVLANFDIIGWLIGSIVLIVLVVIMVYICD
jgi:hypothetical protein